MDDVLDLVQDGAAELAAAHPGHDWDDDLSPILAWRARVMAPLISGEIEDLFEDLGEPTMQGCVPGDDECPFELAGAMELERRVAVILQATAVDLQGSDN